MGVVPQQYFDFIMDYSPYFYVIPGTGVDPEWERGPAPAAHAVDFLVQAYRSTQFAEQTTQIYDKVVELADYLVSIQCTNPAKLAYGGFQSKDNSTYYYSIDTMRAIPALLRAFELTQNQQYYDSAVLAGQTFLYTMQQQPSVLGVHDQYYGGFAQAVTIDDAWLGGMHIIDLYGLLGLKMLHEQTGNSQFQTMMHDAMEFYRNGFTELYSRFCPKPTGDGKWRRVQESDVVYDDDFGYALVGAFSYEGFSGTVKQVYEAINGIGPSADYPGYIPELCWSGYVDVVARKVDSDYYDAVASGILWQIRTGYDKSALQFSYNVIGAHPDEFMYWGAKFADFSPVENKQSIVTVSWLACLFLNYQPPLTPFTKILRSNGQDLPMFVVVEAKDSVQYANPITIKALVCPAQSSEIILEAGYVINDYLCVHVFAPIRQHYKLRYQGSDYEVGPVSNYSFRGQLLSRTALCRRLIQ